MIKSQKRQSQKQSNATAQHASSREQLVRITHELEALRNQSDLVEIMCNFWPLPNMVARSQRISKQIDQLNQAQNVLTANLTQEEVLPEAEGFDEPSRIASQAAPRKSTASLVNRFVQLSRASA